MGAARLRRGDRRTAGRQLNASVGGRPRHSDPESHRLSRGGQPSD